MQNENPNKLNLVDWLAKNTFWTYSFKSRDFIKIGGHEAVKIYYERPNASYPGVINKGYTYLVARDKDIILSGYSSKDGSSDPVLDKLIQSIKFVAFDAGTYSNVVNSETQKIIGEDKNNNGIWDYVEDYINQKYSYSAKIHAGLIQYAKSLQQVLIDNRDKDKTILNIQKQLNTLDCIYYITANGNETSNTIQTAGKITSDVEAEILNTKERFLAYNTANGQFGGQTYGLKYSEYKSQCDFNPDKLPN